LLNPRLDTDSPRILLPGTTNRYIRDAELDDNTKTELSKYFAPVNGREKHPSIKMSYYLYFENPGVNVPHYRFESRVDLAAASSNAYHFKDGCPHFQTTTPQSVYGAGKAQAEAKVTFQLNDEEIIAILEASTQLHPLLQILYG
jgi:hypothetical protein